MQQQPQTSARSRRRSDPVVGGIVLIVIGIALLVAQASPELGRYVVLVIGLGLVALFLVTRSYGALIGGSIVTGVGVGIVAAETYSGTLAGAAFLLSLAGGFLFIWLASYLFNLPERHPWPLIPGAILGSIGLVTWIGGDAANLASYWPVILIVLGFVLIAAAYFRRETRTSDE